MPLTFPLLMEPWWLDEQHRYGMVPFQPARLGPEQLAERCVEARRRFYAWRSIGQRLGHWVNLRDPAPYARRLRFLQGQLRRYALAPRWTEAHMRERCRALAVEHFVLLEERGELRGVGAVWRRTQGSVLGDIKPAALSSASDWPAVFRGRLAGADGDAPGAGPAPDVAGARGTR